MGPQPGCGERHPELPGGRLRRPLDEKMALATPHARLLAETWEPTIHIHHRDKAQDDLGFCDQAAEDQCFRVPFDEADPSHGSHHFEGARSVSRHVSVGQTKEAQQEATPCLAELRGCPRQRHHGCFKCQARQGWCNPQPRCRGLPPRRRKLADRPSLLPPGPRRPESCTGPTIWSPSEVHKMAHYAKCSINNEHGFVPIDSIQYPLLYNKDTEQEATVLLPYQLYSRL